MGKFSQTLSVLACTLALLSCRQLTVQEEEKIKQYASEDTAELCHYLYFPIPDPTASKELKVAHYSAMKNELDRRGVVCSQKYPGKKMYRWRSMLEKLQD